MIPSEFEVSKYPEAFDTDINLHLVHDSLRVTLAEDYLPGDTSISIIGDNTLFPDYGLITLTEQCSDAKERAVSFFYTSKTTSTFGGLTVYGNDYPKYKDVTHVTQNVMARHHNVLKDALIAIQDFVGIKGDIALTPSGNTLEERLNFIRKLILTPRAWFTANKHTGIVPLEVIFTAEAFRTGLGDVIYTWDFGDQDDDVSMISTISTFSIVPSTINNVSVIDIDGKNITKTYVKPGNFTAKLRVQNEYGEDTVVFEDFINARVEAPDEAIIKFTEDVEQIVTNGVPANGPYSVNPIIKSKTNKLINITIPEGIHPDTDKSYAGELLIDGQPVDPIVSYTWHLSDDLEHNNDQNANAVYSIGGLYDLILRCDTQFKSYRITKYSSCIDIVENENLWLFNEDDNESTVYEFGLFSETFKTRNSYTILKDDSFLDDTNNETQAKREFNRNNGMCKNSTATSGDGGESLVVYASGGDDLTTQTIKSAIFNAFAETITDDLEITRPWNWIFLPFDSKAYFLFGADSAETAFSNTANQTVDTLNLGVLSLDATFDLTASNYLNGGDELQEHVTSGYQDDISEDNYGESESGRFAVYRTAQKSSTGYILRNDNVGVFFKFKSFYRTEGTSSDPVINIRKLQDLDGKTKTEGQLVALTNGIFFFNNSGYISAYNVVDNVWETASAVVPFKSVQDTSIINYNDEGNTLVATSDNDRTAYLSFDYSDGAFVKFSVTDLTFYSLGNRPTGNQWLMNIY